MNPRREEGSPDAHHVNRAPRREHRRSKRDDQVPGGEGKYPMEEVTSNLHRLKELMETGKVTDGSYAYAYAVPGKFA